MTVFSLLLFSTIITTVHHVALGLDAKLHHHISSPHFSSHRAKCRRRGDPTSLPILEYVNLSSWNQFHLADQEILLWVSMMLPGTTENLLSQEMNEQ